MLPDLETRVSRITELRPMAATNAKRPSLEWERKGAVTIYFDFTDVARMVRRQEMLLLDEAATLVRPKLRIHAFGGNEFGVRAFFVDLAVFEHNDPIHFLNRA